MDELIDDVAKSMTAAPPDASLARRVSKRIADAGERRTTWARPWVLVPLASACVVMLAVLVARENSGKVRPKPDTTSQATPVAATDRMTLLPQLPQPTVEPIEVDRLELAPLALSQIEINPIAIDRIEITAMP